MGVDIMEKTAQPVEQGRRGITPVENPAGASRTLPLRVVSSGVEQRDETPGQGRAVSVEGSLLKYLLESGLSVVEQKEPGWLLSSVDEMPFDPVEVGHKAIRIRLFPDKAHQQFIFQPARANDVNRFPGQSFLHLTHAPRGDA